MKKQFDIGIIGGMGPKASSKLLELIVDFSLADCDQDHPRTIVLNDSIVPDRTAFLLKHIDSKNPFPYLKNDLHILNNIGVTAIGIACNTAHYFYDELTKETRASIINMVDVTLRYCFYAYRDKKIVVLCTNGTRLSGIFEKNNSLGLNIIYPNENESQQIHNIIYLIKHNQPRNFDSFANELRLIIHDIYLRENKNVCFLVGCTELSLLNKHILFKHNYPYVDALEILALSLINLSGFDVDFNQNEASHYKPSFFEENFDDNK